MLQSGPHLNTSRLRGAIKCRAARGGCAARHLAAAGRALRGGGGTHGRAAWQRLRRLRRGGGGAAVAADGAVRTVLSRYLMLATARGGPRVPHHQNVTKRVYVSDDRFPSPSLRR